MEWLGFLQKHLSRQERGEKRQVGLPNTAETQRKLLRLKHQHQEEQLARKALFELYTTRESALKNLAAGNHTDRSDQVRSGQGVDARRFAFDMSTWLNRKTGDLLEAGETYVLSFVDQGRRHDLQVEALSSAKTFWEKTLVKPDNQPDVVMLGRRRITQITAKLEKLTPI